jgi:hypothetical protein
MPFTSVLGASSVIKPGVCTSSTRPTAPYVGQLVFETDTNRLVVFTASGWVYQTATGAPGLVHITSGSFTSATSFSLPANTFSSTYRNYRMIINYTACVSGNPNLSMRLRASGSDITTALYYNAQYTLIINGSAGTVNTFNQTSFNIGALHNYPILGAQTFDVLSPQATDYTTINMHSFVSAPGTTSQQFRVGSLQFYATTSVDSLSVISDVASSMSGVYRVYGYADS